MPVPRRLTSTVPPGPEDAHAYVDAARHRAVPVVLERSRSAAGTPRVVFFSEPCPRGPPARSARVCSPTPWKSRPELPFRATDRLFPSQDALPDGGFGNLITLPLQKQAREQGNSIFIDDDLVPRLTSSPSCRLDRATSAERCRAWPGAARPRPQAGCWCVRNVPPTMLKNSLGCYRPPVDPGRSAYRDRCRERVQLVLADQIYVPKEGRPRSSWSPARAPIRRISESRVPPPTGDAALDRGRRGVIACAEHYPRHLRLPREAARRSRPAWAIFGTRRDRVRFTTGGRAATQLGPVAFHGTLARHRNSRTRPSATMTRECSPPGTAFAQTVVAARLIAERGVSCLVLVIVSSCSSSGSNAGRASCSSITSSRIEHRRRTSRGRPASSMWP